MVRWMVVACAAVLAMTVAMPSVWAQESRSDQGRLDLSSMTRDELCDLVRQCQAGEGSERCREARRDARTAWRLLLARISDLESRVRELEEQDDCDDCEGEINNLRLEIVNINLRLDELAHLEPDLEDARQRVGELEINQRRLELEIQNVRDSIPVVPRLRLVSQLGFTVGGIYIASCDSTRYSGLLLGPRLSLRVHPMLDVFIEAQAAFSFNDYPVGVRGRAGLQVGFLAGRLFLEIAVSVLWVNISSQLDADSVFLTGEVGLEYRPHPIVGLGVAYLIGAEFDECEACVSPGVVGTVGLYLPRW